MIVSMHPNRELGCEFLRDVFFLLVRFISYLKRRRERKLSIKRTR